MTLDSKEDMHIVDLRGDLHYVEFGAAVRSSRSRGYKHICSRQVERVSGRPAVQAAVSDP